jgi:exodeoxyribonuclease VII small subunit
VPKKMSSPTSESPQTTFEQSLERLEKIVQQLELGRLGLSESLECYEEGVKHLKQCYCALEAAERRIELLTGVDADGNPVTEDFDEAELSLDEKAAARSQRRSRSSKPQTPSNDELPGTLF